jgi:hypothetical protein
MLATINSYLENKSRKPTWNVHGFIVVAEQQLSVFLHQQQ